MADPIEEGTRYRVVVVQTNTKYVTSQEWRKVADTGNEKDNGAVYAYVDQRKLTTEEQTINRQEAESLDLSAIIKAVNGL